MTAPFREPIDLETATALTGVDGEYRATLTDDWLLWGPGGGYTSAIALRAAGELSDLARPTSYFCHFVRPLAVGEIEITAEFNQKGRRSESISVEIHQNGKLALTALVRTAAATAGYTHQIADPPDAPKPEEVAEYRWDDGLSDQYTFWNNFERRPVVEIYNFGEGEPLSLEWVRTLPNARFDNPFVDAARPLILLDTFGYAPLTNQYNFKDFIAPNLDTSAWFHDIPGQSDWLLIEHKSPVARDGIFAAEGRVWSASGALIASGTAHLMQLDRPDGV